jgi:cobyrinic acid a,c-diamide synthase
MAALCMDGLCAAGAPSHAEQGFAALSCGALPATMHCPALLIGAPASGQGKTTVTAALTRWHRQQGRRVRVFKTGPDFLDPMVLERACGEPVHQLDLWMGGEAHCRELLYRAACEADLILVEGVMGLHDGTPSSADLALHFGLPVLAVIDGSAMAQTFGALAHGLASYRPGLPFAGVFANRVGSEGHAQMLRESLPPGMAWFGALPGDEAYGMPSRHLGLVQADEIADLDQRIALAAQALGRSAPALPPPVDFAPGETAPLPALLAGVRIAIARDAAFSFIYRANLDTLRELGAELAFFSPLADEPLPEETRALYLPGGYPELHLDRLGTNARTRESIRAHHARGLPIVAECGGMLALMERLTDAQGHGAPMLGLLPGHAVMEQRLVNLGLHSAELPEGAMRGHTFHHARIETPLAPAALTQAQRHHGRSEGIYRSGRLHASFLHLYFPSNPQAAARLFMP